jgi:cyclic beta-1,2-glucan synthetase
MDAVERLLVSETTASFGCSIRPSTGRRTIPATSRATSPGVRENGGQYTHAALWVVRALAELGRGERAARCSTC